LPSKCEDLGSIPSTPFQKRHFSLSLSLSQLSSHYALLLSFSLSIFPFSLSCASPDVEEKSFVTVSLGWDGNLRHLPF
jgi:hypothetical protein